MKTSNIYSTLVAIIAALSPLSAQSITIDDEHYKIYGIHESADGNRYCYLYAVSSSESKTLSGLYLECFDSAIHTGLTSTIDLSDQFNAGNTEFEAVVPSGTTAYRIKATYTDGTTTTDEYSYYYDATIDDGKTVENGAYTYGSDITYSYKTGWGSSCIDISLDNETLCLTGTYYLKGFGVHSPGSVTFNITPGFYSRFVTDAGRQYSRAQTFNAILTIDGTEVDRYDGINKSTKIHWDYELATTTSSIQISYENGTDGQGQDWGTCGGTRFYVTRNDLKSQSVVWDSEKVMVDAFRNKDVELAATSSSGLPVKYRIVSGGEYATIEGTTLHVTHTTSDCDIVVEGYQPGSANWRPAASTCTFTAQNVCIVTAESQIELESGEEVGDLIVYNNGVSSGQVYTSGMAQVETLDYEYTFAPDRWNIIAFPTDVNIEEISNLSELGFTQNATSTPSYIIKAFESQERAMNSTDNEWSTLETPDLVGKKGYMMKLTNISEPVEVQFTLDNVWLNPQYKDDDFSVSCDFSSCDSITSTQYVYVKPKNVAGNTLKITVDYEPEDPSGMPTNYPVALALARITHNEDFSGLRLTLPTSTPAKVAIYDKSGKKLIKAVRYQSPYMIDITDMKPGTYNMCISYGNGYEVKQFTIPKR